MSKLGCCVGILCSLVLPVTGCGDEGADLERGELPDDDRPYELAGGCADLPSWPSLQVLRVAAASAHEAWVTTANPRDLYHLRPDGTIFREPLEGVYDVRRCQGVTWAVGANGLVARKADRGGWERFDLPTQPPFEEIRDAGVGCDGDLWIGLGFAAHVHDGTSWRAIPTEPTISDIPGIGKLEHEAVFLRGAGPYRVAAGGYGETMAYFPERNAFGVVAQTDDAISDAIVFADGTGATLYNGGALAFDRDTEPTDGDSPLDGWRAVRRTDADIWIAAGTEVRHFDGTEVSSEPLPGQFDFDVDARYDSVWLAGYDGLAVKTRTAWCRVMSGSSPR